LHTRFVPQVVPAEVLPESMQRCTPVLQSVTPALHGAPGLVLHAWLATQARQLPLPSHTWPAPHATPAGTLVSSAHETVGLHTVLPRRHGDGLLLHTAPAAQLMQLPTWQTLSRPQLVPLVTSGPSRQLGAPVEHETTPDLQGADGLAVQPASCVQAMHWPLGLQTWPEPHAVPAGSPASLAQRGWPGHTMDPARQGSLLVVQAWPATHATHWPLAHTLLAPQCTPSGASLPSTQLLMLLVHTVVPSRQGLPALVPQVALSAQVLAHTPPSPQVMVVQSVLARQWPPTSQGGQLPPQSMSVSPGSFTWLVQGVRPSQRPDWHTPPSAQVTPVHETSEQVPASSAQMDPTGQTVLPQARARH
jgi:hypothetical protein